MSGGTQSLLLDFHSLRALSKVHKAFKKLPNNQNNSSRTFTTREFADLRRFRRFFFPSLKTDNFPVFGEGGMG